VNKERLKEIIETAWQSASEAEINPVPPMHAGTDAFGQIVVNNLRYQVFQIVLGKLIPQDMTCETTLKQPREEWQVEEERE
jgi:hypothetical protein